MLEFLMSKTTIEESTPFLLLFLLLMVSYESYISPLEGYTKGSYEND